MHHPSYVHQVGTEYILSKDTAMPLKDDLLALDVLDKQIIHALTNNDKQLFKSAFAEYDSLRKRIKIFLLDQSVVCVDDPNAAEILRKTNTGDGLLTDRLLKHAISGSADVQQIEELSEEELDSLRSDLFYSWFSHFEYLTGLAELRPMVVRNSVNESVSRLVAQIKDCYAFQQYDAAYSLCRTLIEASIRDICVRCQLFPTLANNEILFEKLNWGQLRDKVTTGSLREQLSLLYSELSQVLHGRKSVSKDESRCTFENTIHIIEELYAVNGL